MAAPPFGPRPCPGIRNTASGSGLAARLARPSQAGPSRRPDFRSAAAPRRARLLAARSHRVPGLGTGGRIRTARIPLLWTTRKRIFAGAKAAAGPWRGTGSKIVERTPDFLGVFAREKRPLSLSDISRLLSIPVSSCHDVLQALQERGFIYEIAPRGGYYPTLRLFELGKTITENDPVVHRAE